MRKSLLFAAAFAAIALPAAAQDGAATAVLMDQSGVTLGTVTFVEIDGAVQLTGDLTGVPNGDHGFHIHETGVCDAPGKFESAGGHFNPAGKMHGMENPEGPHAGDLLNITADDNGKATVDLQATNVKISAGAASMNDADGAAIVLHADADDYTTDPSGNSGDRIACGAIEFAP